MGAAQLEQFYQTESQAVQGLYLLSDLTSIHRVVSVPLVCFAFIALYARFWVRRQARL